MKTKKMLNYEIGTFQYQLDELMTLRKNMKWDEHEKKATFDMMIESHKKRLVILNELLKSK